MDPRKLSVSVEKLIAKIGRLTVENDALNEIIVGLEAKLAEAPKPQEKEEQP